MPKITPGLTGDWLTCAQSVALFAAFECAGYEVRFVGGAVRNALLGESVNDLDLATDARPEAVMELAQKAGFKAIGTGIEHGTVTVIVGPQVYEITTLRVDVETRGRHAKVAFTGDWLEDAERRDFTMNALYVGGDGVVIDPLGGYDDLLARRVRFIGDPQERIREDYLRVLRFFRFSAQYGKGRLDRAGLAACTALQKGQRELSRERVGSEFLRLLPLPHAAVVLHKMFEYGFLETLTGRVPHMGRFDRWLALERRLDLVPFSTAPSEGRGRQESADEREKQHNCALNRLAALNMLVAEDATALAKGLRLSNRQKRRLLYWVEATETGAGRTDGEVRQNCYRLGEDCQNRFAISWLLTGDDFENETWQQQYDMLGQWKIPLFPVAPLDLIDRGVTPGPGLGRALRRIEAKWRESDFTLDHGALLDWFDRHKDL